MSVHRPDANRLCRQYKRASSGCQGMITNLSGKGLSLKNLDTLKFTMLMNE